MPPDQQKLAPQLPSPNNVGSGQNPPVPPMNNGGQKNKHKSRKNDKRTSQRIA